MKRFVFFPRFAAVFALLAGALTGACGGSSGGPEYAEIGIDTATTGGVALVPQCLPLPLLPGGTIDEDVTLAPSLSAHVFLVRDYADITLGGTDDPDSSHVQVPLDTLLAGYRKDLDVTTADGQSYDVTLLSPCATAVPAAQ
ncbi:MAG TPA: hypothetical protein VMI54_15180 [Polyangiaceae bacterium]|nr:hypothetical protein [Polyangiaceae bacterium]